MSRIFLYSSAERPWRAMSSSVIWGWTRTSARESRMASLLEGTTGSNRRKYLQAVFAAEKLVCRVFRVRHQAEDIAGLVANTGDILERPVRVRGRGRFTLVIDVTKQDLPVFLDPLEGSRIRVVAPFAVFHRHSKDLPFGHLTGKRGIRFFHP